MNRCKKAQTFPKWLETKTKPKSLKRTKAQQKICLPAIPIIDSNSSVFLGRRNNNPTKAQWFRSKIPFVTGPKMQDTTSFRLIYQDMKVTQQKPKPWSPSQEKYPKSDLLGDKETHVFEIRLMHILSLG